MRRAAPMIAPLAMLLAGLILGGPAAAVETKAPPKLTLSSLPAAVQKTVKAESKGAVISAITRETGEDGKPVYEIESKVKGLIHDYVVGEDGTVLISERQVALDALPAPIREGMIKAAAGRKIGVVESVTRSGKLAYYEAQVGTAKVPAEIKVGLDGVVIP